MLKPRPMRYLWWIVAVGAGWCVASAQARVGPQQASELGRALTPTGAERAGNAAGTIPAWTGGGGIAGLARESPLYIIDADHAGQYRALLPDGALALFKAFPDYQMRVFPTHRSAALPASVYQAIARNAVRAQAVPSGIADGVADAAGGVPFPIPSNGTEIVWNHLLSFWGAAREAHVGTYIATGGGSIQQSAGYQEVTDFPYYAADATANLPYYFLTRREQDAPPARAGEAYIAWQPLDVAQHRYVAWRYLPGEHRVRKAPSLSYDTPDPDASGFEELDDYYLFFGGPDRYIFRLIGKREMLIPYNNDVLNATPPRQVMGAHHVNAALMRYELHRVWVVEGTLAPGKHHVAPRRRLYIDEDSWMAVYADAWDEDGKLWKFSHATMMSLPAVPATVIAGQFVYDLLQGGYVYDFALGGVGDYLRVTPPHSARMFDAEGLIGDQLR